MSHLTVFFEVLQLASEKAGCSVVLAEDGSVSLFSCGVAELIQFISELHQHGYFIVSSRSSGKGRILGIMETNSEIPAFFRVQLQHSTISFPETTGLFMAFLGPDGVGKTTTVHRVMEALRPAFPEELLFHWRPQLIKPRTAEDEVSGQSNWLSINRHGDPPRSALVSLLRLAGVFADYFAGHFKVIAPALNRGALVVFDRYYHDILVDSRRYRYGGPTWLLHLMRHLLPQRKVLFAVLDADDSVILTRKQEVAPGELRDQRRRYAELAHNLPDCIQARTDGGLDAAVSYVLRAIGERLSRDFEGRLLHHKTGLPSGLAAPSAISAEKAA